MLAVVALACRTPSDLEQVKRETAARYPQLSQWSPAQLAAALDANAPIVLLDVRTEAEYEVSHLQHAVRVDPDAEVAELEDVLAGRSQSTIVCYCAVGVRSAHLCARLQEAGYTVHNLNGSIFEWANQDRPLYQGDRRVDRVHPYDAQWGVLLRPDRRAW